MSGTEHDHNSPPATSRGPIPAWNDQPASYPSAGSPEEHSPRPAPAYETAEVMYDAQHPTYAPPGSAYQYPQVAAHPTLHEQLYGQTPQQSYDPPTSMHDYRPVLPAVAGPYSNSPHASAETAVYSAVPPQGGNPTVPVTPSEPAPRRRRGRELLGTAVVAALVAGGTTAGVLAAQDDNSSSTTGTTVRSSGQEAAGTGPGPVPADPSAGVNWASVADAVQPSVVAISVESGQGGGQGSGVIVDGDGRILTNNHVVNTGGGANLTATLFDGRTYRAEIVGTDPSTDLAVIKMQGAEEITPATLGDSAAVGVGAPVMVVGNPLGLAGTVTTGIVSALDRPVVTTQGGSQSQPQDGREQVVTNAIQTDAAVNPGNSGGALVDAEGRVIGIPSSIATLGQSGLGGGQSGSIGLGFAIPINEAKAIADQLIQDGQADQPYIGIRLEDASIDQGAAKRSVARITTVESGTPAEQAELKSGDSVLAVNGEPVNGSQSLVAQIRERRSGQQIELTIWRDGREQTVRVTLADRPGS
ncbi:MAG: trypsin-like peptidase domain-containing protein [Actinomycetota bacterium]